MSSHMLCHRKNHAWTILETGGLDAALGGRAEGCLGLDKLPGTGFLSQWKPAGRMRLGYPPLRAWWCLRLRSRGASPSTMPGLWQTPIRQPRAPTSVVGGTGLPQQWWFSGEFQRWSERTTQVCVEPKKTGGSSAGREGAAGVWLLRTWPPVLSGLTSAMCPCCCPKTTGALSHWHRPLLA